MNSGKTVFSQVLQHLPRYELNKCINRYNGNYRVKNLPCWNQFLCMVFAQLTGRESLRDIETCLNSHHEKLYHTGFRSRVSRSTLADANELRDYRIYQDFGYHLIDIARNLYQDEELALNLEQSVYALDSTTIDLCLSLFLWAHFRKTRAAVKIHTLLKEFYSNLYQPHNGQSPRYQYSGYSAAGSRIHHHNGQGVYRLYETLQHTSHTRILCRSGKKSKGAYPEVLRRVSYVDIEKNKRFIFLTNNFNISAKLVADIYKQRWQVGLFFKWIKQHLRIKKFYGTPANAVKKQELPTP